MGLYQNLARIRPADVEALSAASDKLAIVAATIRGTKSSYVEPCVALLIEANDRILAVRDRGLARIKTWTQREQDRLDAEARATAAEGVSLNENLEPQAGWPKGADDVPKR